MKVYKSDQILRQLEKRRGGYYYLKINEDVVNQFNNGRHTRLICIVGEALTFSCGLNHFGDGNFFIIVSTKRVKDLGISVGDSIAFELRQDPNPLGVNLPEVLTILLEQDERLKQKFEALTLKKRSLVHAVSRIKDIDKQVAKTSALLNNGVKLRNKPIL